MAAAVFTRAIISSIFITALVFGVEPLGALLEARLLLSLFLLISELAGKCLLVRLTEYLFSSKIRWLLVTTVEQSKLLKLLMLFV
jgi:hypothetical protein